MVLLVVHNNQYFNFKVLTMETTLAQQYKQLLEDSFPGHEFVIAPDSDSNTIHYVCRAYDGTVVTVSKDITQIELELQPKPVKVKRPRKPRDRSRTINIKELK